MVEVKEMSRKIVYMFDEEKPELWTIVSQINDALKELGYSIKVEHRELTNESELIVKGTRGE